MNKIKSAIIAILVLVSFSLNAQSPNKLKQKAEEEIKAEEAYWDDVSNMYRCILFDSIYEGTHLYLLMPTLLKEILLGK